MSDLRSRTVGALGWAGTGKIVRQALQLFVMILLARLLSPREFGLVAMVSVVTGFAFVLTDLGFGAALIQNRDVDEKSYSSVFWLNIAGGAVATGLFVLGAPLLARFYNEPALVALTSALAFNFILQSFQLVPRAILRRRIDFRPEAVAEIAAIVISGCVGIGAARFGYGVWSLVAKSLVDSLVIAIGLWWGCAWTPNLRFDITKIRELWNFSSRLIGTQTVNYWTRKIDDLLIGRFVGSTALGAYERAYRIMLFPLQNISNIIARVLFPSMSEIQEDIDRVRRIFLRTSRSVALITFPLMAGLCVLAEPFVVGVFGQGWELMIPILRILAILGALQSIFTLNGNLFMATGRTDLQFKVSLALKPVSIAGIVIGLNWGAVGVAVGYTIAEFVTYYPATRIAGGLVNLSFVDALANLSPVFLSTVAMVGVMLLSGMLLPEGLGVYFTLITQTVVGAGTYFLTAVVFKVEALSDTYEVLHSQVAG